MGIFFKKKKSVEEEAIEKAEKERRERIKNIIRMMDVKTPGIVRSRGIPVTREYKQFLKEISKKPSTFFEKACKFAEKLNVKPSKNEEIRMKKDLESAYINATPTGVTSLAALSFLLISILGIALMIFGLVSIFAGLGFFLFAGFTAWYIYNYPSVQARVITLKMSSDSIMATLYMVIYMRNSPNLEGALRFAAENLKGPLSWDLQKLLWDINLGVYDSADSALVYYMNKWKKQNPEFAQALNLLRESTRVGAERRKILLDETIDVILKGTKERTKHYAASLRMPMMIIHAMGILLPVMGLVLFPIIVIFMSDVVKPVFIFIGYNIMLPLVLWFVTDYILQKKPPTFSQPDISQAKGVPPMGYFRLGNKNIPIWPISLLFMIPIAVVGYRGLGNPDVFSSVNYSILIISSIAIGIAVYCILDSWQKMKIRNDIEKIEDEFPVALFQLGNQISGGVPLEVAINKAINSMKDLRIADMFRIAAINMQRFGYTFDQALFDKKVGAIWYYPSRLIRSVMSTIIETSRKSVSSASSSMITISNYLKGVHEVKEDIKATLGETISSMKFLAMFLAPMVAGVTVTMAVIILQILTSMGSAMTQLVGQTSSLSTAQSAMLVPWAMSGTLPISPAGFQLVVGLYMIETAILLSVFINRIEYGEDEVGLRSMVGSVLIFALIIYVVSWFATYLMFGPTISVLLTPAY